MKKKVLFIIGTLQSGGVSKSLVNLINAMNLDSYDVHCLLLTRDGDVFSKYLPNNIVLHCDRRIEALHQGFGGIKKLLLSGYFILALGSLLRICLSKISKSLAGELLAKLMPKFTEQQFDLIVDYGGQQQLYYMVDKLNGEKKITFFHSDYSKWDYYYKVDKKYYPKVDAIFTISPVCVDSLKKYFPQCENKIQLMENISSPAVIQQQAMERINVPNAEVLLASLGHFSKAKGGDLCIEAGKLLKEKKINYKWLFIGKILEQDLYEEVKRSGLAEYFIFIGIKSNPYPYIKECDIFVHSSRFEGKSIALDEAKILCKPIIVTNFSTVNDQFENGVNALICDMNGKSLADTILEIINHPGKQQRLIDYLKTHIVDNTSEIKKIYQFL